MDEGVLGLWALIALILGLWLANIDLPFSDQRTVYTIFCDGEITDNSCEGGYWRAPKYTITILKAQQSVVIDSEDNHPRKYENCTVADRSNWICITQHGLEVSTRDGQYRNGSILGITKFRWWLMRVSDFLNEGNVDNA